MKFEEVIDDFRKGAPIRRAGWGHTMVYVPGDSITLECLLADDWCVGLVPCDADRITMLEKQVSYIEQRFGFNNAQISSEWPTKPAGIR